MRQPRLTLDVTIPTDADGLSDEINLGGWRIAAIHMSADWTAGDLTFQAATASGGTFFNVYDDNDTELTVQAAEDRVIGLREDIASVLSGITFLKIRSGTSGVPVQQGAERTLTLALRP